MKIAKYNTELDDNFIPVLVKEEEFSWDKETLNSPQSIVDMLNSIFHLDRQAEERVYMLCLNNKCRPLGIFELSHGAGNFSICNPREVFLKALSCGASSFVLFHNHPSGDSTPSQEDIEVSNKIKECGYLLALPMTDNIVVGRNEYSSFKSMGLI